jgi:DnaJ-class molecular chaperone
MDPNTQLNPGDEAVPGTPGTGEAICGHCQGGGVVDGQSCPMCGGTGTVIEGIGGG